MSLMQQDCIILHGTDASHWAWHWQSMQYGNWSINQLPISTWRNWQMPLSHYL